MAFLSQVSLRTVFFCWKGLERRKHITRKNRWLNGADLTYTVWSVTWFAWAVLFSVIRAIGGSFRQAPTQNYFPDCAVPFVRVRNVHLDPESTD